MEDKIYIKKIVRDDGAKFEFDGEEVYLAEDNELLRRPDPDTTAVDYTEADGGEMIAQKNPAFEQEINGLIVPKTSTYWQLVSRLTQFFKINHTYQIIYSKKDGSMFSVSGAWIDSGLQVPPTPREEYSEWTVGFMVGNEYWREYAENSQGEEIYSNKVILPLLTAAQGGEEWSEVGEEWDTVGGVWSTGSGGVQSVNINSINRVYPVWTVSGEVEKPELRNLTTDTSAYYNGNLVEGQTLVVDFSTGEARINGALVSRDVIGVVKCEPGENMMGFSSSGGDTDSSTIEWNNIIG